VDFDPRISRFGTKFVYLTGMYTRLLVLLVPNVIQIGEIHTND